MQIFESETMLPASLDEVFAFFSNAENLGRITPPSLHFRIRTPTPVEMREGALIDYTIRLHGIPMHWKTRIREWNPPFGFVDEQLKGPYRTWIHEHRFLETDGGTTLMRDRVQYALPFAPFGLVALPFVRAEVARIFEFRRRVILGIFDQP